MQPEAKKNTQNVITILRDEETNKRKEEYSERTYKTKEGVEGIQTSNIIPCLPIFRIKLNSPSKSIQCLFGIPSLYIISAISLTLVRRNKDKKAVYSTTLLISIHHATYKMNNNATYHGSHKLPSTQQPQVQTSHRDTKNSRPLQTPWNMECRM